MAFYILGVLLCNMIIIYYYMKMKQYTVATEPNNIEWHWHHYSERISTNTTSRNVLIAQYTGLDTAYMEFTNITQKANRAYAKRWKYDYLLMMGTAFNSDQMGIAAYNKLPLLRKAVGAKIYDVILILDSDAVVVDFDQNVLDLMPESMLLTACRNHESGSPHTWNVNNGVTIWNLRHERIEEVYSEWHKRLVARIGKKNIIPSDQAELHEVLKEYGEKKRQTIVNGIYSYHFRFHEGSFVKHVVRSKSQTWISAKDDLIRRKTMLQEAVQEVCTKWKGACD